jgi:hypothetical protein
MKSEEAAGELRALRRPLLHLLPNDGVRRSTGGCPLGAERSVGELQVDLLEGDRAVALESERAKARDHDARLLPGDVGEDHVAGRLARAVREVDQVDHGVRALEDGERLRGQLPWGDDAQVIH